MIETITQEKKDYIKNNAKHRASTTNIRKEDSMNNIKQNIPSHAEDIFEQSREDAKSLNRVVNEHEVNVSNQYELSDEVDKYKNQIVTLDNHSIMEYGHEAQNNLTKLSRDVLEKTESSNVKPISKQLEQLVQIMNDSNPEEMLKEDERS